MTKKDYDMIALALREGHIEQAARNDAVVLLIRAMKRDNPGFKPDKFVKACGADTSVLLAV